jgi:carbon storage regulator CsrA
MLRWFIRPIFSVGQSLSSRGVAMQIISRRENEAIVIDNDIVVTVLDFEDDFVRLAIESPHEEPSYREEVIHLKTEYAELQSN